MAFISPFVHHLPSNEAKKHEDTKGAGILRVVVVEQASAELEAGTVTRKSRFRRQHVRTGRFKWADEAWIEPGGGGIESTASNHRLHICPPRHRVKHELEALCYCSV
jgi:hypothetical protein